MQRLRRKLLAGAGFTRDEDGRFYIREQIQNSINLLHSLAFPDYILITRRRRNLLFKVGKTRYVPNDQNSPHELIFKIAQRR